MSKIMSNAPSHKKKRGDVWIYDTYALTWILDTQNAKIGRFILPISCEEEKRRKKKQHLPKCVAHFVNIIHISVNAVCVINPLKPSSWYTSCINNKEKQWTAGAQGRRSIFIRELSGSKVLNKRKFLSFKKK